MATRGGRPSPRSRAPTAANPAVLTTSLDCNNLSPHRSARLTPATTSRARRSAGCEAPVASTTLWESMVRSRPVLRSLISVSQPDAVRRVEIALCPFKTRPFGAATISPFIACPTNARNSAARSNGTVASPASTNSLVRGWLRNAASSLSGGPARQSAKVKAVLSELMHQRPMLPAPTASDCSTMVTPALSKSARRPRL